GHRIAYLDSPQRDALIVVAKPRVPASYQRGAPPSKVIPSNTTASGSRAPARPGRQGRHEWLPVEQARIVQLLVQRVDLKADGLELQLRTQGLGHVVEELGVIGEGLRRAA